MKGGTSLNLEASDKQTVTANFPQPLVSWSTIRSSYTHTHPLTHTYTTHTHTSHTHSATHWTLMWSCLERWRTIAPSVSRELLILEMILVRIKCVYPYAQYY